MVTGIVFDHGELDPRSHERGRNLVAGGYVVYCGDTQSSAHMRAAEAYLDRIFPTIPANLAAKEQAFARQ